LVITVIVATAVVVAIVVIAMLMSVPAMGMLMAMSVPQYSSAGARWPSALLQELQSSR
jgi:hypothetical protein